MSVAVISSVFGRYDEPVFVEQTVPCSYVLVSDGDLLVPSGWEHVQVRNPGFNPRLMAKFAKCRPWTVEDADFWVWLDGSILPAPELVDSMLDCLGDADAGFYPHPDRTTITSEARASFNLGKYGGQRVVEQADTYVYQGHPDGWGLWAAGLFILRNTLAVRQMGQLWLEEICRWSLQDQLSLPVVMRQCGLRPVPLHGHLLGNPLFKIRRHADST